MSADDRKVWAREIRREKKPVTLQALLTWMVTEMKSQVSHVKESHGMVHGHKCWYMQIISTLARPMLQAS